MPDVIPGRKIDYEQELNGEQVRVVQEGDGPCLVLAGAGSGKTRAVTYRVAWLIEHGVSPDRILLLTFTNKAASEMLRRVEGLLGRSVQGIWGGTFHGVANRILRVGAAELGFTPGFTILDADDAKSLMKACVKDHGPVAKDFPSPAVIADTVSYARNANVSVAESLERKHPDFSGLDSEIGAIAAEYAKKKRASNAMDFDDLLSFLLELLVTRPQVATALAGRFEYVLVDEYQDTNPIQAEIVDRLASVHHNLLVVGDDAQSIYSFRAATVENILSFPKRYPGAKVFRLETNYRSTPEILAVANDVISGNSRQFTKILRPVRGPLAKPTLIAANSTGEEAGRIVRGILDRQAIGIPLKGMAVLFRATHHSQELEFELAKAGLPYEYRGGMKFFERSHIKDVVSFLKLKTNPQDVLAWTRILSLQSGIGETGAGRLAERLMTLETIDDLGDDAVRDAISARSRPGFEEAKKILGRVAAATAPAAAVRAVAASSYNGYLIAEYPNAQERLDDLEQFARFAEGYAEFAPFLAEVTLKDDYGSSKTGKNPSADEDKLVLTTIHQAKGLEWDTVFVMRLANGSFPHMRSLGDEEAIEEERRLFYVAVTRAQSKLVLTYPLTAGYDTLAMLQPSRFLTELGQGLVDEARRNAAVRPTYPGSSYVSSGGFGAAPRTDWSRTKTVWTDSGSEATTDESEDTIELDSLGEVKKPKRSGLLRSVEEL